MVTVIRGGCILQSPRSQVAKSNESDAQLQAVMEDFERMKEELERTMSQYEELQQHSEKQKLHWMNKYHRLKCATMILANIYNVITTV